jgi:hypothetical protein
MATARLRLASRPQLFFTIQVRQENYAAAIQ